MPERFALELQGFSESLHGGGGGGGEKNLCMGGGGGGGGTETPPLPIRTSIRWFFKQKK